MVQCVVVVAGGSGGGGELIVQAAVDANLHQQHIAAASKGAEQSQATHRRADTCSVLT